MLASTLITHAVPISIDPYKLANITPPGVTPDSIFSFSVRALRTHSTLHVIKTRTKMFPRVHIYIQKGTLLILISLVWPMELKRGEGTTEEPLISRSAFC
jgi:hypothetical protein